MYKNFGIFVLFVIASLGGLSFGPHVTDAATTVTADRPSFQADLKNTLDLQAGIGKPTFIRADGADRRATVTDFEGLIRPVKANEARFEGARRVENLLTHSEDFSNAAWTKSGTATVTGTNQINLPAVNDFVWTYGSTVWYNKSGDVAVFRVTLSGSGTVSIRLGDNLAGANTQQVTLSSTPTVFSISRTSGGNGSWTSMIIRNTGDTATTVIATKAQMEDVTGQANQNPSEYVSTNVKTQAPYHGANVDGVKYFTTYNGNTVSSNVVTEATGAAIPDATLKGYLAEGARTNLLSYSEQFDNVNWTTSDSSVTANAVISPAGTLTADKLVENSTTNGHNIRQGLTTTAIAYTYSVYLKAGGRNWAILYSDGASVGRFFNLSNGTMGGTYGNAPTNSIITSVGNGWYRCTIIFTSTAAGVSNYIFVANADGVANYTGDGTSGIYIWGAQSEAGAFASSYIPTTSAVVTRAADVLTYPTSGNALDTQGSAYAEVTSEWVSDGGVNPRVVDLGANGSVLLLAGSGGSYNFGIYDGINLPSTLPFSGSSSIQKVGSLWGGSSKKAFLGGNSGSSETFDGGIGVAANMHIGEYFSGGYNWFGTIRNVKIWKKALTDTQLTNLTSGNAAIAAGATKGTTVGADGVSFQADLKNTLDLQAGIGKPTFTRADGADRRATVTDFEGLIKPVKAGEARFEGARRVENINPKSEADSGWTAGGTTPPTISQSVVYQGRTAVSATFPTGASLGYSGSRAIGSSFPVSLNSIYTNRFAIAADRLLVGDEQITVYLTGSCGMASASFTSSSLTTSWKTFSASESCVVAGADYFTVMTNNSAPTSPITVYLSERQVEDVTGQANQNPSEYVSTGVKTQAPYHGANVDGVKYFTTQNGNTVASNVVTEATGTAIPDATLKGYLAEGSRTNLKSNSEDFSAWVTNAYPNDASATVNAAVAPDGKSTADLILPSTGTASHIRYQGFVGAINTTYTFSVYLKAGGYTYAAATLGNNAFASDLRVFVNLTDGTVVGGYTTASVYSVTSAGNGWYRLTVQNTSDANGGNYIPIVEVWSTNNTSSYAGNGTSGVYAWGAQVEQASFASSYIPTTSASVTRAGDALTYPTAGNVDGTKGTAYAEVTAEATIPSTSGDMGYGNNNILDLGVNMMVFQRYLGNMRQHDGTIITDSIGWNPIKNIQDKIGAKWGGSLKNGVVDGIAGTPGGFDGDMNVGTNLSIGNYGGAGGYEWYGNIRNVKIWKKALTDGQLTNLTSTTAAVSQSAVKKTTVNTSQNTKLTTGLVGLWSFNGTDMSGTTAYDRSGSNNNGTLTNGPTKTPGKVGQALNFDGVDDSVLLSSSRSLAGNADWTVSSWVKTASAGPETVLSNSSGGPVYNLLGIGNSKIWYYHYNGSWVSEYGTSNIANNDWHFLTWVNHSNTTIDLYVDGVAETLGAFSSLGGSSGPVNQIGMGWDGSAQMNGKIDEVRIYNRALSATEVKQLYNLGR